MENQLSSITVTTSHGFSLSDHLPSAQPAMSRREGEQRLKRAVAEIGLLQERMMAGGTWSLLAIFQGMDTSGKDGTIARVFAGIDPAGVIVTSFKAPSSDERAHDFLRRIHQATPPAGRVGVFNRSHYEDVLVPRIHPDQLHLDHIPPSLIDGGFWHRRLDDIAHFEQMLSHQGTIIHKFFLNISKQEQRKRLMSRLKDPAKNWKFQPNDLTERGFWNAYHDAYDQAIRATATPQAPWHIIPADHKWYARTIVAEIISDSLGQLHLAATEPNPHMRRDLEEARRLLRMSK